MAARKTPAKKTPAVSAETLELAEAKLAESGLDWSDATTLSISVLDNLQTADLAFEPVPGLLFKYMHPITREPLDWWPKAPPYVRARKLREQASAFGEEKKKKPKYMQAYGTRACAYFPMNVNWEEIALDPDQAIFITEGELKSAKACKEGFPTIGLGGVDSWKSLKTGSTFLPELDLLQWSGRNVYIIYDSDTSTNPNVARAVNALAEQLMQRGAFPHYVCLPNVFDDEEKKTGFDDYLVHASAEEFVDLYANTGVLITLVKDLWFMNEKVVYVKNPGIMVDRKDGSKFSPDAFAKHRYSTKTAINKVINSEGKVSYTEVAAAPAWLGWPLRAAVDRISYSPGFAPLDIAEKGDEVIWNTWPGWGCGQEPDGDVQPFLDLCEHLFKDSVPGDLEWFYQWLAYPIQYPGTKLFTSVLLWGPNHGTGKSLIGYTMKRIYGKNFTELNQTDLYKDFNGWAENKQFVMGDDITGTDKQHESDILKKFITQESFRLNIKHVAEFEVEDVINYYFTANQPVAMFLEDDDRRSFIHEVTVGSLDEMFYQDYKLWLDTTGPAALHWWLRNKVDTSKFNPAARARETQAKKRMIMDARSDIGEWVSKLKEDPDQVLRLGEMAMPGDLMTNKQLLSIYDPLEKSKVTGNGLGRELRKRGFSYALGGASVKTAHHHDRYYIVRNQARWAKATLAEVKEHLNAIEAPLKEKY